MFEVTTTKSVRCTVQVVDISHGGVTLQVGARQLNLRVGDVLTVGIPVESGDVDPWVCNKCGQRLAGPASLCNSGIHVGPGDGEEAQGEAVRLSASDFIEPTNPLS